QFKKLLPGDGVASDQFGFVVSIYRDSVAVGSPFDDDNGSESGSAYLFARNAGGTNQWNQTEKFIPNVLSANGNFGFSLSLFHETLVVGAPFDATDNGTKYGAMYVYRLKFNNAPRVVNPIPDQAAVASIPFSFTIPANTFGDGDIGDMLVLTAGVLPSWL